MPDVIPLPAATAAEPIAGIAHQAIITAWISVSRTYARARVRNQCRDLHSHRPRP